MVTDRQRDTTTPSGVAAIVLAAGKGTRMNSDLHKVLHPLCGKPMLGHVLETLAAFKIDQSVVVVGAGKEQIAEAFPDLQTVEQKEQLGTAHAVVCAHEKLHTFKGDIVILYGDVPLIKAETLHKMVEERRRIRGGVEAAAVVLGFEPSNPARYGRLVTDTDGCLEKIVEFADATATEKTIRLCNSGIMTVKAELLFDFLSHVSNNNAKGEFYLTDIVEVANNKEWPVRVVYGDELEVSGVNSQQELKNLESKLSI